MYHDYNGREIEDLEGDNMRRDSIEEETDETQKCAICGKDFSVDDLEECPDCKRATCENCTEYEREWDTGAMIPECCKECYDKRCKAEYLDEQKGV